MGILPCHTIFPVGRGTPLHILRPMASTDVSIFRPPTPQACGLHALRIRYSSQLPPPSLAYTKYGGTSPMSIVLIQTDSSTGVPSASMEHGRKLVRPIRLECYLFNLLSIQPPTGRREHDRLARSPCYQFPRQADYAAPPWNVFQLYILDGWCPGSVRVVGSNLMH